MKYEEIRDLLVWKFWPSIPHPFQEQATPAQILGLACDLADSLSVERTREVPPQHAEALTAFRHKTQDARRAVCARFLEEVVRDYHAFRSSLTVLPADDPNRPSLGWKVRYKPGLGVVSSKGVSRTFRISKYRRK